MTENTQSSATPQKNNGGAGRTILIVILALAVVGLGVFTYLQMQENKELEDTKAQIEAERDSYIEELNKVSKELDEKIRVIDSLGGDITELIEVRARLETEKEQIRRSKDLQLRDLRDKVEGYEYLLKEKDKEIEKLQKMTESLMTENTELKNEQNELKSTVSSLNVQKTELEEKVTIASQLKAENIKTVAINNRGKERDGEFRPKHIEQLKIDFNLAKNDVAPIGGRDILIRIIDPQGNALFDVATGSGTFVLDGREIFYTAKQEILFDNTQQKIGFVYQKTKEFTEGKYTIEIYEGNRQIGKTYFVVK